MINIFKRIYDKLSGKEKKQHTDKKTIRVTYATNIGIKRKDNQDNFYVDGVGSKKWENEDGSLDISSEDMRIFAVFDGMGGEDFGEEASKLAAARLSAWVEDIKKSKADEIKEIVNLYARDANNAIVDMMIQKKCNLSGTTVALVCIKDDCMYGFSMGDSKIILCKDKVICQISEDQTVAAEKVRANIYTEEEARMSSDYSKLTDFVGMDYMKNGIQLLYYPASDVKKCKIILCSDGVYNGCSLEEMQKILSGKKDKPATEMINKAMQNGSKDNVTCVVIEL